MYLIKYALALALCIPAEAQTISFAPQGAAALKALTGKRIKGIQIVSVVACPATISIPTILGGEVYREAMAQGYTPIMPQFARAVVNDAVAKSPGKRFIEGAALVTIIGAGIATGKINPTWSRVLLSGHQVLDQVVADVQAVLPNSGPLTAALLDPAAKLDITAGCQSAAILAVYPKKP
jgi:hypothetical protein